MRIHKRKKAVRLRGGMTHGYGSKKKHRGAGNRGGVGMAGSGKRADTIKPGIWKQKHYFGKHGFVRKNRVALKTINISYLEAYLHRLKHLSQTKQGVEIDLSKEGYNKLLGTGRPTRAYNIKVDYASKHAKQKIEAAGGKLMLAVQAPTEPAKQPIHAESLNEPLKQQKAPETTKQSEAVPKKAPKGTQQKGH